MEDERNIVTSSRKFGRARSIRMAALAVVAATAVTTGVVFSPGAQATSPTVPPWQTGTGSGFGASDPHKVATLSFYNAAGTQIFGGSTTAPLGAYVQSSAPVRAGDDHASLYAYTPSSGSFVGDWSGSLLTASGQYPIASPPGSVSPSLPVYSTTTGDTKLADFIAAYPNGSSATGYQGVYELRLRTNKSGGNATSSTDYAVADIEVTGNTWQVFGSKVDPGSVTESVPATATYGAGFQVTATVAGSGATPTGTATLKEGSVAIGADATLDGAGHATFDVSGTALTGGSHDLTVTYNGDTTYNSGVSAPSSINITQAASTVTPTVPATATYGTAYQVTAIVGPGPATGTASLKEGAAILSTVNLVAGKATFPVAGTKLAPGTHALTVTYSGSVSLLPGASTPKSIVVGKAIGKASNALSPKSINHTKRAKLIVKVTATGLFPTGVVTIYDGTKVIGHVTLTAANKGTVTFLLPKLKKGSHKLHALYGGSTLVKPATAAAVTLKST